MKYGCNPGVCLEIAIDFSVYKTRAFDLQLRDWGEMQRMLKWRVHLRKDEFYKKDVFLPPAKTELYCCLRFRVQPHRLEF